MTILKKLTQLTSQNNGEVKDVSTEALDKKEKISFHDQGYNMSKSCSGNSRNLRASLDALYQSFENKCKEDLIVQEKLKRPYITEQKGKKTSILNKNEELDKLKMNIKETNDEIDSLNKDCRRIRTNPEEYVDVDTKASAKFWIGISFLIPLAIYVFIFYISTSFSAFFREFDPSISLFQGMFDPQALSKAYDGGILELGFVLFIPFVFFALGYLIHMFQEREGIANKLKIAALFVITFIFDAILAYLIDQKLYNLNKTFESEEFNISIAFQSVSFWLIIFAGFVSYIVWGLVFDFVMKEHADRDKIKNLLKEKREEIVEKEQKIEKLKSQIITTEEIISSIKVRVDELQSIIDGFILPVMNYKALSTDYLQGWKHYISSTPGGSEDKKNTLLLDCRKVFDKHMSDLDINTDTYQNKLYTKRH
jgi:hypothetical protein